MKVLILSANPGEGHNSCAKAIADKLSENNTEFLIYDGLSLVSKGFSSFICGVHVLTYRYMPFIFSAGYSGFSKIDGKSRKKSDKFYYRILYRGVDRLYELITENGFDTVICTHPFPALILSRTVSKYSLSLKTSFMATDYNCSPTVGDTDVGVYFIPHESVRNEFITSGIENEKIAVSGMPVKKAFFSLTDKYEEKKKHQSDPENKHILIACGSMGCGKIPQTVDMFFASAPKGCELTVVCGTNQKLYLKLFKKYGPSEKIHIIGYTSEMPSLMASADVFITKPGGISISEALAVNLPMVFLPGVGAYEKNNMLLFEKEGFGVVAKNGKDAAEKALDLLDTGIAEKMRLVMSRSQRVSEPADIIIEKLS